MLSLGEGTMSPRYWGNIIKTPAPPHRVFPGAIGKKSLSTEMFMNEGIK